MNYWIVVASPSRARIYSVTGHYDTLHFLQTIEPRYRPTPKFAAGRDNGLTGGYPREQTVSADEATADFARQVVRYLDAAFHRGDFHLFTIVAPRRFLDVTVHALNPVLDRHLRKCVAEDYLSLATEQLQPIVHTMLPNLALI